MPLFVLNSNRLVTPFVPAYLVGSQVLARVPVDLAIERVGRLHELLEATGVEMVTTATLRRALEDISNSLDGPDAGTIAEYVRVGEPAAPLILATSYKQEPGTGVQLFPPLLKPEEGAVGDGGGKVYVRAEVTIKAEVDPSWPKGTPIATRPGQVAIVYQAANVAKCCWIQFLWEELLIYKAGGTAPSAKSGNVSGTSGSFPYTTDPTKPAYHVDSSSKTDPCYSGTQSRTDTSLEIYDMPDYSIETADTFDATKAEQKIHFDDYLVCDGSVLYKLSWEVIYTWVPTGVTRQVNFKSAGNANKLDEKHKETLQKLYPDQTKVK